MSHGFATFGAVTYALVGSRFILVALARRAAGRLQHPVPAALLALALLDGVRLVIAPRVQHAGAVAGLLGADPAYVHRAARWLRIDAFLFIVWPGVSAWLSLEVWSSSGSASSSNSTYKSEGPRQIQGPSAIPTPSVAAGQRSFGSRFLDASDAAPTSPRPRAWGRLRSSLVTRLWLVGATIVALTSWPLWVQRSAWLASVLVGTLAWASSDKSIRKPECAIAATIAWSNCVDCLVGPLGFDVGQRWSWLSVWGVSAMTRLAVCGILVEWMRCKK